MKLSQLIESFVISNDEFEDYLNRATEQLTQELQSGKNSRDAVHDLALTFADQHNKSYDAYTRMSDSLSARMHTLELDGSTSTEIAPADMTNGPDMSDMGDMGAPEMDAEPEMMTDPMGDMEMDVPAEDDMPGDSDMEDYAAVMDNEPEVEESYSPGDENEEGMVSNCCGAPIMDVYKGHGRCSDCKEMASAEKVEESVNEASDADEKARQRAFAKADEPERGEKPKKVSLKKAPWEESINEAEADEDTVRELVLYADNDGQLYKQSTSPIRKNLSKKFAKGVYDHDKAIVLWKYHADRAAKKYGIEHGNNDGFRIFSPADRRAAAKEFADEWKMELDAGNMEESVTTNEAGGYYTQPVYDMIKKHGIEKVMHELLTALDADVIQDALSRMGGALSEASNEVNDDEVRELVLFADNDGDLYSRSTAPIQKNLTKKFVKGTYDHDKAIVLWKYHADRAAKMYGIEHGNNDGFRIFSPAVRKAAAKEFADAWKDELDAGNLHEVAPIVGAVAGGVARAAISKGIKGAVTRAGIKGAANKMSSESVDKRASRIVADAFNKASTSDVTKKK